MDAVVVAGGPRLGGTSGQPRGRQRPGGRCGYGQLPEQTSPICPCCTRRRTGTAAPTGTTARAGAPHPRARPASAAARTPRGFSLLLHLLAANWTYGRLTVLLPNGETHRLEGAQPGPTAIFDIKDYRFARRVLASGDIGFAEGYMAGEWESPQLAALLESFAHNYDHIRRLADGNPLMQAINWLSHKRKRNSRAGSKKNIHAHYDLGNAFYGLWLDDTMNYSSAWFETPDQGMEAAQHAKVRRALRMTDVKPGDRVLEIGCGWGALAEKATTEFDAHVTGVTLSTEILLKAIPTKPSNPVPRVRFKRSVSN